MIILVNHSSNKAKVKSSWAFLKDFQHYPFDFFLLSEEECKITIPGDILEVDTSS